VAFHAHPGDDEEGQLALVTLCRWGRISLADLTHHSAAVRQLPIPDETVCPEALMVPTSPSLLERLREPEAPDWDRFVRLYTPLLYAWVTRLGPAGADADDVVQEVFAALVQQFPTFHYDRTRRFRGWLWGVVRNKVRDYHRASAPVAAGGLSDVADRPGGDPADELDDREYQRSVTGQALVLLQSDFEPATWRAFWETAIEGRPAAAVAAELGLTPNAVYLARGRVLRRLRAELAGLLD
jgi:RNA polymerase sigma-70 factor (ECF subfamily)